MNYEVKKLEDDLGYLVKMPGTDYVLTEEELLFLHEQIEKNRLYFPFCCYCEVMFNSKKELIEHLLKDLKTVLIR